jgi:hypothetical protein
MSDRMRTFTALPLLLAAAVLAGCGTQVAPSHPGVALTPSTPAATRAVLPQPSARDGALDCPTSVASADGMAVPHPPQGLDGAARLLPHREPTSLVVCAYPVMALTRPEPLVAPFALSARTVPDATLRRAVVDLLTWAPRWNGVENACTAMAADETAYLVGASYDDAIVWVAARADANTCSKATNGDFVSGAALGVPLRELLTGQPRPAGPVPANAVCGRLTLGRLGDDRSLVPPGNPVATVCRLAENGVPRETALDAARSAQVVATLRALDTRTAQHVCQSSGKDADRWFGLVLTYPTGPSVRLQVDPGCAPEVLGSGLESDDAGDLVDLVESVSPPIPGPDPDGSVSSP